MFILKLMALLTATVHAAPPPAVPSSTHTAVEFSPVNRSQDGVSSSFSLKSTFKPYMKKKKYPTPYKVRKTGLVLMGSGAGAAALSLPILFAGLFQDCDLLLGCGDTSGPITRVGYGFAIGGLSAFGVGTALLPTSTFILGSQLRKEGVPLKRTGLYIAGAGAGTALVLGIPALIIDGSVREDTPAGMAGQVMGGIAIASVYTAVPIGLGVQLFHIRRTYTERRAVSMRFSPTLVDDQLGLAGSFTF